MFNDINMPLLIQKLLHLKCDNYLNSQFDDNGIALQDF